jgi:hypothetical protein
MLYTDLNDEFLGLKKLTINDFLREPSMTFSVV